MMDLLKLLRCLPSLLVFSTTVAAQPALQSFSFSGGGIHGITQGFSEKDFLPFAEVEATFGDLTIKGFGLSLSAAPHLGFWSEKATSPDACADCIVYSFKSATFGARGLINLTQLPVPVSLLAGYSRHAIFAQYAYGTGIGGNGGEDYSYGNSYFEWGARVLMPVGEKFQVGLEGIRNVSLDNESELSPWRFGVRTAFLLN